MRRATRSSTSASVGVLVAVLVACGTTDGRSGTEPGSSPVDEEADVTDAAAADGTVDEPIPNDPEAAAPPFETDDGISGFDRGAASVRAEGLLGRTEEQLPPDDPMVRVARRGDEELPGTMDLRPGRANVELDDEGNGSFVVTRVVVEVPDGETPIVIE